MPTPAHTIEQLNQAVRAAVAAAVDSAPGEPNVALEAALADYYAAVRQLRAQIAA